MKITADRSLMALVASILLVSTFFQISDAQALEQVYAAFEKDGKPTMIYRPKSTPRFNRKYDLTVGILPVQDRRVMNFYWYKDDLFEEPIPLGFSDILYNELRSSQLFKKVKRINSPLPSNSDNTALQAYKEKHGVDMVISADLVAFNMLREKAGKMTTGVQTGAVVAAPTRVMIDVAMFAQLIHLESGTLIWADLVERRGQAFALMGVLAPEEVGSLTRQTLSFVFGDLKMLLSAGGKTMLKR